MFCLSHIEQHAGFTTWYSFFSGGNLAKQPSGDYQSPGQAEGGASDTKPAENQGDQPKDQVEEIKHHDSEHVEEIVATHEADHTTPEEAPNSPTNEAKADDAEAPAADEGADPRPRRRIRLRVLPAGRRRREPDRAGRGLTPAARGNGND